jgi:hypothetical protein
MMERMIDWLWQTIDAITGWTTFIVLLLLFAVFLVLFNRYGAHYPRPSFDGQKWGIAPSDVEPILHDFRKAGQLDRYFAQETQLDLIFPAVYGLLWAVMIVGLRPRGWRWLIVLPIAMALFDYCENFSYIALVVTYRQSLAVPHALAVTASVFSRLKWTFLPLALIAPLVALVRRYV